RSRAGYCLRSPAPRCSRRSRARSSAPSRSRLAEARRPMLEPRTASLLPPQILRAVRPGDHTPGSDSLAASAPDDYPLSAQKRPERLALSPERNARWGPGAPALLPDVPDGPHAGWTDDRRDEPEGQPSDPSSLWVKAQGQDRRLYARGFGTDERAATS